MKNRGQKRYNPKIRRQQRQIKSSQNKGTNPDKDMHDVLLGDLIANTKKNMKKAKATGQPGSISINDIGIYEFVFQGLPNPPDLEGMDEDRLFELQRNVQEQLHKRDEERERNIKKRVQEFEKTFDFVNSHLLKGVATMAELTKTDNRQSLGKIKPARFFLPPIMQSSFFSLLFCLCKLLGTGFLVPALFSSRLHLLSEGCAFIWGVFVRGGARRDLC